MVTLTTLSSNASGPQGFAMFLDGLLVGLQSADEIYSGKWQLLMQVHLCATQDQVPVSSATQVPCF